MINYWSINSKKLSTPLTLYFAGYIIRREEPMTISENIEGALVINLALLLENNRISIAPRDIATRDWIETGGYIQSLIDKVARHWMNQAISKKELRQIAAQLEYEMNAHFISNESAGYGNAVGADRHRIVRARVRACEYRPVVVHEELVEL
jgi:hypothetical protein